jgi:integrase
MLYKEKTLLANDLNEIDKKIYELGQNALKKNKRKFKHKLAQKVAIFYLTYLFGLRVSEALRVNIYKDLIHEKIKDKVYYILYALNLKHKDNKDKYKTIFFYPSNEYEKKMLDYILKNFDASGITRFDMAEFCKYYIKDIIIANKEGNEVKVFTHLNIHSLRHIRAYVLLNRYGDKDLILNNFGWKREDMLYYYSNIAKSVKEIEIKKRFIQIISQKF